jgi:hypothetical protein
MHFRSRRNYAKACALLAVAAIMVLAVNFHGTAQGQSAASASSQKSEAADEHAAIRRVAELYITFEQAKLREAFYPTANLYLATEQGQFRTSAGPDPTLRCSPRTDAN